MSSRYIAICSQDMVGPVSEELQAKGAMKIEPSYAAIQFEADEETAYRLHLQLQTPSRLLQLLRKGGASSLAAITNQARKIKWDTYFRQDTTYLIEAIAGDRGPDMPSATQISKSVRLGLEDYFKKHELPLPKVDLKDPSIRVVAFLWAGELTISLDTSGKSMHKRGYRADSHPAPIKENLGATLLKIVGYNGSQNFYDPMCGSGTLAIEAAFISLNKAPLIHRKKGEFGLENLRTFDSQLWRKIQEECRKEKLDEPAAKIFAADIDVNYVKSAQQNALRARVEKFLDFSNGSFFDLPAPSTQGILVSNFPYGERIGKRSDEDMVDFYKKVGDTLKQKYMGWTAALLVGEDTPYKFIGLRPKRKIPVDNGGIKCRLLIFDLYQGKKGSAKISEDNADNLKDS